MKILLVLLLSLSVPVTALSATVSLAKCEHRHAMTGTLSIDPDHALSTDHASQGDHSQHSQHTGDSSKPDTTRCGHCSSGHCASGTAGLSVGGFYFIARFDSSSELIIHPGSHTAVAHSIDLLRPPNLI